MDTAAQWPPQDIVVKPMEEIVTGPTTTKAANSGERKVRPQKEQALNCPRCNSTNTKFCYYNNYSLSQPRYFCKTCRRYWTEGGSLRNIPVGGGSRKNKRSSSSSSSSSSSTTNNSSNSKKLPDLVPPPFSHQNPSKILDTQDLNLGLISIHNPHHDFKAITEMIQVPNFENSNNKLDLQNPSSVSSSLELLTGIGATTRGLSSFMAAAAPPPPPLVTTGGDPGAVYNSSGFASLVDFKPSLSFSLDGLGSNYGSFQGPNGKLLFPFEDLKSSNANGGEESRDQHGDSTGYWNGVIGGGSW